jgi:hypothetical protein
VRGDYHSGSPPDPVGHGKPEKRQGSNEKEENFEWITGDYIEGPNHLTQQANEKQISPDHDQRQGFEDDESRNIEIHPHKLVADGEEGKNNTANDKD